MDFAPLHFVVTDDLAGQTLAQLLSARLGHEWAGHVLARGGVWLGRYRVQDGTHTAAPGTSISVHYPPAGRYSTLHITAADIVYEDRWLLALNKQPGWYVTPTPWDVLGNVRAALVNFLRQRDGEQAYLHLLHQLDRDTSGLLLCSKDRAINAACQIIFDQRGVHKEYLCACAGEVASDSFELQTGHGRGRSGLWRLYDLQQVGDTLPNGSIVKLAYTSFRLHKRLPGASLLRARLHTGRTHQIRLHLAALGYPLLGDERYGGPSECAGQRLVHHLLHADLLQMEHPVTGDTLRLQAPAPPWPAALAP